MSVKIMHACKVRPSELGAKGFFYPRRDDEQLFFVQGGAEVEILNFICSGEDSNLQAVAISNAMIEGLNDHGGTGVYWIDRKNLG